MPYKNCVHVYLCVFVFCLFLSFSQFLFDLVIIAIIFSFSVSFFFLVGLIPTNWIMCAIFITTTTKKSYIFSLMSAGL